MTTPAPSSSPASPRWVSKLPVALLYSATLLFAVTAAFCGLLLHHSHDAFIQTCGLFVILGALVTLLGISIAAVAVCFSKPKSCH